MIFIINYEHKLLRHTTFHGHKSLMLLLILIQFERASAPAVRAVRAVRARPCTFKSERMATSAEPARVVGYSPDIGWRVVWQRVGMGFSFRRIAARLQIGLGTAHKIYTRFVETGEVAPLKPRPRPDSRALDEFHVIYVLNLLTENPSLYLGELCQKIRATTGIDVSGSTVCRLIKKNGMSRKKIVQVARQRCIEHRGAYMAHILQYPVDWLVFLDETGCDNRDNIRRYGYSFVGESPVFHRFLSRGNRISAIAAISQDGLTCYELVTGTTNGDTFYDFIRGSVIQEMQPFPGKKSVLIMDNCSIHHIAQVKDLLEASGILLVFLPPYSPDYNPIEKLFSYVKYYLKTHDELLQVTGQLKPILHAAFSTVSVDYCQGWIKDSGY